MPRRDGSGPEGQGPMSGRAMGGCDNSSRRPAGSAMEPGNGRRSGRNVGKGRGLGQRIAAGFSNLRQRRRVRRFQGGGRRRNSA